MAATHFPNDDVSSIDWDSAANVPGELADIKLVDSLARDPKPVFLVQADPRPSCRPWPVIWLNNACRTSLSLARNMSIASSWTAHSPTSPSGLTHDDSISTCVDTLTTHLLSKYDHEFRIWLTDRLTHPDGGGGVPYFTCSKGIFWTTTTLNVGGDLQYLQFIGIPLSWKPPALTPEEKRSAERSFSEISAQTLNEDIRSLSTSSYSTTKGSLKNFKGKSKLSEARKRDTASKAGSQADSSNRSFSSPDLERRLSRRSRSNTGSLDFASSGSPIFIRSDGRPERESSVTIGLGSEHAPMSPVRFNTKYLQQSPGHLKFIKDYDWGSTAIGSIENWPQSLRTTVVLMCASSFPSAIYYGPDFTFIYNEAYKDMMPTLHPWSLGKPCREVWKEGFEEFFPARFEQVMKGIPTFQEENEFFLIRDGAIEQTFFSWALNPIVDETGVCTGISNISVDLTTRVLASRGFQMFGEVGTRMSAVTDRDEFWRTFLAALQTNQTDAPFALVYSRVEDLFNEASSYSGSDDRKSNSDLTIQYEGSYNIPEGHICMPPSINLDESDEGFAAAFREACGRDLLYLKDDDLLPPYLLEGLESPFGDSVVSVAVAPIHAHSAPDEISGFLVLGLNTRRPFNDDYQLFVRLLVRQLSTSLSTSLFFETEARRSGNMARMAAMEKIVLSSQLAAKTSEARASESRFKRLTEVAPVGIYMCDQVGNVTFVNDAWHEITAVPKDFDAENWIEYVHPDDREGLFEGLANIRDATEPVVQCVRWITPYTTKDGQVTERWTKGISRPEYSEDGTLMGYLGVSTSIAEQRLRETTQKKLLEDARELKRQQDVSHPYYIVR
ncbi:hypothetical protein AA313_de0206429 [Arthrobotrys entomopaga]|nr:hypothetical protein AA313_de0206429 [Arthrobotrys entomopaga]